MLRCTLQVSDTARRIKIGAAPGALVAAIVAFFNMLKSQLLKAWDALMARFNKRPHHDPEKITIKIVDRHGAISRSGSPTNSQAGDNDIVTAGVAVGQADHESRGINGMDAGAPSGRGAAGRGAASGGGRAAAPSSGAKDTHPTQGYGGASAFSSGPGAMEQQYTGKRGQRGEQAGAVAVGVAAAAEAGTATEGPVPFDRTSMEMEGMTVGELKQRLGHALSDEQVPRRQQHTAVEAGSDEDVPTQGGKVAEGGHEPSAITRHERTSPS